MMAGFDAMAGAPVADTIFNNTNGLSSPEKPFYRADSLAFQNHGNMPLQNEITPGDFDRKYEPFTEIKHPVYHRTLKALGDEKVSWKVDRCGTDAIRLRCNDRLEHEYYAGLQCDRRTCPECVRREIYRRYNQFHPLTGIIKSANEREGLEYPSGWEVRFFTLTTKAKRGELKKPLDAIHKALFRFWRNNFGERSDIGKVIRKNRQIKPGGLFYTEIQGGWNVHLHGLVLSPFRRVEPLRKEWSDSLKMYGWEGNFIQIKRLRDDSSYSGNQENKGQYNGALFEILQYPVKPDKEGRHDEELLAYVENALRGHRRFVTKGDWYNSFPEAEHVSSCPVCCGKMNQVQTLDGATRYYPRMFAYNRWGADAYAEKSRKGLAKANARKGE